MEIKINRLRLHNFKGVRSAEYAFMGANARIEGPNGSGKSTVFDAFTWLLFGKDHRGQSTENFELKTIDPATGNPYPREEHWVEAELTVDGRTTTLRRVWAENWVKPTGETQEVMKGHTSTFIVDGVDVGTKKAYDTVVNGWMSEDMFKMLTNPHFFIDEAFTPWKKRRQAVMELVKDAPDRERVQKDFADVIEALSGRSVEEYRKRLASERNANKKDLEICQNQISGIREGLPEPVDDAAVKAQIAAINSALDEKVVALRAEMRRIDGIVVGGDNAQQKAEHDEIWGEITRVQLWMSNCIKEARSEAQEKNKAQEKALFEAKNYLATAEMKLRSLRMTEERIREELDDAVAERGHAAVVLDDLGKKYTDEKSKAFDYTPDTKCPYCGQELPAETQEEALKKAREHFMAERKEAMDGLLAKAKKVKDTAEELKSHIDALKDRLEGVTKDIEEANAEYNRWTEEERRLSSTRLINLFDVEAAVRDTPEFREKAKEEQELRVKANAALESRSQGVDDLLKQRSEIEKEINTAKAEANLQLQKLNSQLAVNKVRQEQLALIARKEQEAARFADAIAKDERLDARAAEFVKADIESVGKSLEGIFHVARWKMFDRTLDGGLVEMCEVTSQEGVPYKSMNDAMKILCGLDVIRAFSAFYGMRAPIFIDNAESITRDRFDTEAQVIRLVVKDCEQINLITE